MPAPDYRLTTIEVAQFVADGFLRFDALVPDEVNRAVLEALPHILPAKLRQFLGKEADTATPASLTQLSQCYPAPSALGALLRLPQVHGLIASLVGEEPTFDHDFVHHLKAGSTYRQHLHVDAILDSADPTFDIQLFYFPHDVAPGAGGTRFVPGSHLRRVRAEGVGRYQHLLGERQFAGTAGTVLVAHHGLWHAGEPNPSERDRWMYKIRLNPAVAQTRLWNTDDLEEVQNDPSDHVFARARQEGVAPVLRRQHPWQQGHEPRYDLVQRSRLWRYLSGDPHYDLDYYLTRVENRARLVGEGV
jgi:hypothetical protein